MTTPTLDAPQSHTSKPAGGNRIQGGLLDPKMLWKSMPDALRRLLTVAASSRSMTTR